MRSATDDNDVARRHPNLPLRDDGASVLRDDGASVFLEVSNSFPIFAPRLPPWLHIPDDLGSDSGALGLCLAKTRSLATDVSVMVTTTANQWAGACVCSPESHRGLLPANRELAANPGGQISATVARLSTGCHSGGEARVAVVQTTDFWALDDLAHTGWVARG